MLKAEGAWVEVLDIAPVVAAGYVPNLQLMLDLPCLGQGGRLLSVCLGESIRR